MKSKKKVIKSAFKSSISNPQEASDGDLIPLEVQDNEKVIQELLDNEKAIRDELMDIPLEVQDNEKVIQELLDNEKTIRDELMDIPLEVLDNEKVIQELLDNEKAIRDELMDIPLEVQDNEKVIQELLDNEKTIRDELMIIHEKIQDDIKSIRDELMILPNKSKIDRASLNEILKHLVSYSNQNARQIVAKWLKVKTKTLCFILYGNESRNKFYKIHEIKKDNGDIRVIHAVQGPMRILQDNLYLYLSSKFEPSKYATGFIKGKNIIDNAKVHRKNKVVLKFDIKDFFPSITFARVRGMFMAYPFNMSQDLSTILAQICCLDKNGPIPQGGITSPYISNMICRKLDARLSNYAKKNKLKYSRYADDMIFSSNFNHLDIILITKHIIGIIEEEKFTINSKKTKALTKNQPQSITGILVNEGLNVRRTYIRNIRAILHNCEKSSVLGQAIFYFKNAYGHEYEINTDKSFSRKGSAETVKAKFLKDRFLSHLYGKIMFVGLVAKANEGLKEEHFKKRDTIYKGLLQRYIGVTDAEDIRRKKAISNLNLNATQEERDQNEIIRKLKQVTGEKLDEQIGILAQNNINLFLNLPVDVNIQKKLASAIEMVKRPQLNDRSAFSIYKGLQDSRDNILGKLVHEGNMINHKELKDYRDSFMADIMHYPSNIAEITLQFIESALTKFETVKTTSYNFWKDTDFKEQYILPFKQRTRYDKFGGDEGADFWGEVKKIINDVELGLEPENKRINYNQNELLPTTIYADVSSLNEAIRLLLQSMSKNSQGNTITLKGWTELERQVAVIEISDDNANHHFSASLSRSMLAHGKVRKALSKLYGFAKHSIFVRSEDNGWQKIDMFNNKLDNIDNYEGYSHRIEIPQI